MLGVSLDGYFCLLKIALKFGWVSLVGLLEGMCGGNCLMVRSMYC